MDIKDEIDEYIERVSAGLKYKVDDYKENDKLVAIPDTTVKEPAMSDIIVVSLLCAQNRIEDAILKGNAWLIPENAEKPDNPRRVRKMGQVGE